MIRRWLALTYHLYALRLAALSHFYFNPLYLRVLRCYCLELYSNLRFYKGIRQPESRAERFQAAFVSDGYFCGWFSSHCHCCFRVAPTARCFSSAVASPDVIFWKSRLTAGACRLPLMRMGSGVRSPAP